MAQTATYLRRVRLPVSAQEAFAWHERPGALQRLLPPWAPVQVVESSGGIRDGGRVTLRLGLGPMRLAWVAEHADYQQGRQFCDVQRSGPFAQWKHTHLFQPQGPDACVLEDRVEYALPGGFLGRLLAGSSVRRRLDRLFQYRHQTTFEDLAAWARYRDRPRLRVAVSGSSGLIGSALTAVLSTAGHRVDRLVREPAGTGDGGIAWDPATGQMDTTQWRGVDAVVHLAGENLAARRWSPAHKARVRASRVEATGRLCQCLARLDPPPGVFVSASAIGYYGDRGDEELDEGSPPGSGFLPQLCRDWEAATEPLAAAGTRVVLARFGLVLSPRGGALPKLLTPFRWGAGGRVGSGRQFWSWISLDDAVAALHHALLTDSLAGPVNLVAPEPVTNRQFTRTLARLLRRPALAPLPAWAARLALGEMADAMILASTCVTSRKLLDAHYPFRHPSLDQALAHLLGRPSAVSPPGKTPTDGSE